VKEEPNSARAKQHKENLTWANWYLASQPKQKEEIRHIAKAKE
jgi:hypothetical protein